MSYIYLLYFFLLECYVCLRSAKGWEYLNLPCRDNGNEPVDWWYIYKPPRNSGPHMDTGTNFSYIDVDTVKKWTPAPEGIMDETMLRYTIAPAFNEEFADYVAIMEYETKYPSEDFPGSVSRGMMMANSQGGIWIVHTIPGFPNIARGFPSFPEEELKNGHMIMCLTLDLSTLNALAASVKQTEPYIKRVFIPPKIEPYLQEWKMLLRPLPPLPGTGTVRNTKAMHFVTKGKSLRGMTFARSPGDSRCLYKSFAKTKQIVLDVYGHKEHNNVYCSKQYSIRHINSISLKYVNSVYYIKNSSDSMGFAVSTAANWQKTGTRKNQFWACTGNIENQYRGSMGGMIVCANHFRVWLAFDNLKVREPDCYHGV